MKKKTSKSPRKKGGKKAANNLPIAGRPDLVPQIQTTQKALTPYDPLQRYLLETKKYKLLTRAEEIELAKRVREDHDEEAAYRLATSNLRLVVKIAMDFNRYWTKSLLDLIQEGNLGLLQAVKKFDPYRGIKFSYYASFWIKAYMHKFIMDNWKLVKIGTTQTQRKLFFNLAKEKRKLAAKGFDPEPKLLAESLGVNEKEVVEMSQRLGGWEISLSSPVNDDSKESYGVFIPDPGTDVDIQLSEAQSRQILSEQLAQFRKTLSGKEADIFDSRIMAGKPVTLQELGDKYAISRERIRQIQEKIIKDIKKWLKQKIPNFEEEYSDFQK